MMGGGSGTVTLTPGGKGGGGTARAEIGMPKNKDVIAKNMIFLISKLSILWSNGY